LNFAPALGAQNARRRSAQKLKDWTGSAGSLTWRAKARAPTAGRTEEAAKAARHERVLQEPLVRAVARPASPGAEIPSRVRDVIAERRRGAVPGKRRRRHERGRGRGTLPLPSREGRAGQSQAGEGEFSALAPAQIRDGSRKEVCGKCCGENGFHRSALSAQYPSVLFSRTLSACPHAWSSRSMAVNMRTMAALAYDSRRTVWLEEQRFRVLRFWI